jgi:hypothetical protein
MFRDLSWHAVHGVVACRTQAQLAQGNLLSQTGKPPVGKYLVPAAQESILALLLFFLHAPAQLKFDVPLATRTTPPAKDASSLGCLQTGAM